jgi:hypothetical protein
MVISNWHYVLYSNILINNFVNGGFLSFFYVFYIFVFVLIEENNPDMIYWKLSFFTIALNICLKLVISSIKVDDYNVKIIVGSFDEAYDVILLIIMLFQLILYDEIGLKENKLSSYEDTTTAFVRMSLNNTIETKQN